MREKINNKFIIVNRQEKEVNNDINITGKNLIYEVLRVIEKVPLFLEKHITRLNDSIKLSNFSKFHNDDQLIKDIDKLININNVEVGNIKIVLDFNNKLIYLYFVPHNYPKQGDYINGIDTILFSAKRKNPNVKYIDISLREKINLKIKQDNVFEAILFDEDGYITEGSRSNIFLIKGNQIYTSPSDLVLKGITREIILEICKNSNIKVNEIRLKKEDIISFDGLFLCGTSPKILPIKSVSSYKFNSSSNSLILDLINKYNLFIDKSIKIYTGKTIT
ncbi:MAG: aminotransferase class IV [Clostridiaceae bacterium]